MRCLNQTIHLMHVVTWTSPNWISIQQERIWRKWRHHALFVSNLARATEKAKEGYKNYLKSDLTTSNLKNFPWGAKSPPPATACIRTQSYSAGPIQFCFQFNFVSAGPVLWMAFIDQGEFEPIKMLSSRRPPWCDKHQFHAKMMVSTQTISKILLLNIVGKWHFHDRTLLHLAVFRVAFDHLHEPCWSRKHSKRNPGCLNNVLVCLLWSYRGFA